MEECRNEAAKPALISEMQWQDYPPSKQFGATPMNYMGNEFGAPSAHRGNTKEDNTQNNSEGGRVIRSRQTVPHSGVVDK